MVADFKNNFWKIYPELTIPEALNKYYTADKSKDKTKSSLVMWAIHMAEHPESKFYNNPDKLSILAKSFLKDVNFKWNSIKDIVSEYKATALSPAERALQNWDEIIILRDNAIKDLYRDAIKEKDTDELVKIDKMLSLTPKMFDDYKKIKQSFEEEKTHKKGTKIASLSDDDVI